MAWRKSGSKFKNSLNSDSKVVVLQVIKLTELQFPLFFDSSVIPGSFRVSPLYGVFLLSSVNILNICWLWLVWVQVSADCLSDPIEPDAPLVTAGQMLYLGAVCNCQVKNSAALF